MTSEMGLRKAEYCSGHHPAGSAAPWAHGSGSSCDVRCHHASTWGGMRLRLGAVEGEQEVV